MFHIFQTENENPAVVELDHLRPLYEYVQETYNLSNTRMVMDSIPGYGENPTIYRVAFNKDGEKKVVYAELVDKYSRLEDYVDNSFEYNLYQLFAISEPGVEKPDFDQFTMSRRFDPGKSLALSIIPGLGQIYKGQNLKGWIFMGSEALLIGGIIYSNDRYKHYVKLHNETGDYLGQQRQTFKDLRTFCIIAGAGLYVYNLCDAFFCKVAPYVSIKQSKSPDARLTFTPTFNPEVMAYGVGLNLNF